MAFVCSFAESIAAAAAVASSDEASPSVSLDDIDLANLPPPPDFLLEATLNDDDHNVQAQKAEQKLINERSLSVAEAVKTLNEIRHQPASPGVVRRAQSMRVANETADSVKQQNKQAIPAAAKMTIPIKGRRLLEQQHQRGHHTLRLSNLQHSSSMKSHGLKGNMKTLPKHLPSQQRYPVEVILLQIHYQLQNQQYFIALLLSNVLIFRTSTMRAMQTAALFRDCYHRRIL